MFRRIVNSDKVHVVSSLNWNRRTLCHFRYGTSAFAGIVYGLGLADELVVDEDLNPVTSCSLISSEQNGKLNAHTSLFSLVQR
jgi:hypothetical protein